MNGSTVAIAHTTEKDRSEERVLFIVREVLAHFGGMTSFVKPDQTVNQTQPNRLLLGGRGLHDRSTYSWRVDPAAKEAGAKRVQVAESSGGFLSSMECMRVTGVEAVAEREGAELIDLGSDAVPNRTVEIPNGTVIHEVPLPEPLLDADLIIDACKAKEPSH